MAQPKPDNRRGDSLLRLLAAPPHDPRGRTEHKNPPPFDAAKFLQSEVRRDAEQRREGAIRTYTQGGITYLEPVTETPPIPPEK